MKKGKTGVRRRRKIRPQVIIGMITALFILAYFGTRVFLNSKTLAVSSASAELMENMSKVQEEVDSLEKEIQNLENRSTVLGKVDTGIRDNPGNVVIIDQD